MRNPCFAPKARKLSPPHSGGIGGSLGATYGYDSLDRLTSETGTGITQSFTWDANSNRMSDGAGGYSYAPNTNREVTSPQGAVVVDGAGYTTSDRGGARSFTWSPAGDMATATMSGTTATYTYREVFPVERLTLYHAFVAACNRAGIEDYTWHDLRHEPSRASLNGATCLSWSWPPSGATKPCRCLSGTRTCRPRI